MFFYSEKVLVKVLYVWDFINEVVDEDLCDLFQVVFGVMMVFYLNYFYELLLGFRVVVGKFDIEDVDVVQVMWDKLLEMYVDLLGVQGIKLGGQIVQVY